jgi:hypothetical protein
MDVCVHQLGLNVYKFTRSRGLHIGNIAPRASNPSKYEKYPSIIEVGFNKKEWIDFYGETLTRNTNARIEETGAED